MSENICEKCIASGNICEHGPDEACNIFRNNLHEYLKSFNKFEYVVNQPSISKAENFSKQDFIKVPQLFDNALIVKNTTSIEGQITCITERGVTIRNSEGNKFFKWQHVKEIRKT